MTTKEEAKEIIEKIARKYGYLRREMMDDIGNFNAEYRREIDDNWLSLEHAASHSIKVLANNIYGSGARFVFELLQNAEDNKFTKADGLKSPPFISFKVHPKHIVVDCNEDGFTWPDLTAICSVGDSTKSAIHGYIGAKGIGFKSVFIAASRVHIQSGNFSFEFRHKKTDPGLGMVRPIWVRPVDSIPNPLTRTTLYLHDEGEQEDIEHLKAIISMQFNDLHETCLLFLCKLQQISVAFYDDEGNLERSKQFRKRQIDDHRVSLETITFVSGKETTKSQIFHIAKQYATGLAPSDNREPPKSEDERQMSTTAEVVLAFPLTNNYEPQISRQRQELFAFLPLRPSDYKFHIHSDFDTNANRQDIITTSRRNRNIRDCIATAFYQAVLQFCDHPTLCYQWPLFLPAKDNSYDSFWSELDASIQSLIIKNRILKSRNGNALRLISDVSLLTRDAKDENGNPLFDDTIKDPFLSPKYPDAVIRALKEYGFKIMNILLFLDLLKSDLKSANSKMRGGAMTEEWHSRVARLLSKFLNNNPGIRSLHIIPLRDGRWTSCDEGAVYLPATGEITVPVTLNLRVVDSSAVQNRDRRTLFEQLGMAEATIAQIRESINVTFASTTSFSISTIVEFLSYLYFTHQTGVHTRNHYQKVKIGTKGNILVCPHTTVVYLPGTNHPYSPESLLAGQRTVPNFPIAFLMEEIFKEGPAKSGLGHPSWKTWLVDYIGIHERLSLLSPGGDALSDAFLYVFNHQKDKFLGLFENLWLYEGPKLLKQPGLVLNIAEFSAKELCKVNFSLKMKNTWLPLQQLHEYAERYMVHPKYFPFLKIEGDGVDMNLRTKWYFLAKHFSVGKDDNIEFLLEILTCIRRAYSVTLPICQSQRVFDLYVAIYAKLAIAQDQNDIRSRIRQYFAQSGIIDPEGRPQMWTRSFLCRWAAPASMTTVHSLKSTYARRSLSEEDMSSIENLFHRTLGIGNATSNDIIQELKKLQEEACDEDDRILNLYKYLHLEVGWGLFPGYVGEAFEKTPLIFVRRKGVPGWFRVSDCLWSSETAIRGKVTLDESYDELKDFFVHRLGVKSLTLQMVYDELKQSPENSPEVVKVAIRSLNEFLQIESGYFDPEPIKKAKVFPIRYPNGTFSLGSTDVAFAIGDRARLKTAFEDKVSLLDFDLEDVRRLKPFFGWLGLQERYLSNCVKETTSISTDSGRLILSGKRFLKAKAYYITRVAATFNSLRFRENPRECYESLRTMDVREVDEISLVLKMSQNGHPFESRVATASEHISEIGGKLTIYVAKDPKVQDICFGSVLPRKLASWLASNPNTNAQEYVEIETISALTSIFASDRLVLDEILDDQGIIQIPFDNDDEDESLTVVEEQTAHLDEGRESADIDLQADRGSESRQPPRQVLTPTDSSEAEVSSHIAHNTDNFEIEFETVSQTSHMTHQGRPTVERHSPEPAAALRPLPNVSVPNSHVRRNLSSGLEVVGSVLQEDVRYRSILERVVETARSANFPHGGAFDMQDLRDALPDANLGTYQSFDGLDVMESMGSSSQQERDKRVGAAGELYVFELLSKLELPGWGRGNWQSTIRKYATVHPDYADLSHWSRRETADLVYVDASGRLTSILVEAGILTSDEWSGKQPTYYFEVKTTTGPCKTPFYMSGNQYRLMERIHYIEDRSEVYMVFRIYSLLDGGRINYCVYMDPKKLRDEGRLVFTEGTWSVRPGSVVEQE